MKPRLEPAEHTPQDAIIWAHLTWRGGPRGGSLRWTLSLMQDRRDAELMLEYEWKRRHGFGTSPLRREICRWSHL